METPSSTPGAARYVVMMPVYDDWAAVSLLLPTLDQHLNDANINADVLLVNDCSPRPPALELTPRSLRAIPRLDVLNLTRNLGHQRAIAVGLAHLAASGGYAGVVVMDSDGEDLPADVVRLIDAFEKNDRRSVVFAARIRRSEGVIFSGFYHTYRLLHWLFTGIAVRVGNFSVIPTHVLERLAMSSELWNHYAAAVFQSRVPIAQVPLARGQRLSGASHMNFTALVSHGLGAMAVFAERIGVRLLIGTLVLGFLLGLAIIGVTVTAAFAVVTIPPWATVAFAILIVLFVQSVLLSLVFIFVILHGRASTAFIPARDCQTFIKSVVRVWARE